MDQETKYGAAKKYMGRKASLFFLAALAALCIGIGIPTYVTDSLTIHQFRAIDSAMRAHLVK